MTRLKNPPTIVIRAIAFAKLSVIFIFANNFLSTIHAKNYRSLSTLNLGNGVYMVVLLFALYLFWVLLNFIKNGWNAGRYIFLFIYTIILVNWIIEFYGKPQPYLHFVFILGSFEIILGAISLCLLFTPKAAAWYK